MSLPPLIEATSGAFSSAVSNISIYPLDLVTTRCQTQGKGKRKYHSLFEAFQRIVKEEGSSALYRGVVEDTFSTMLSNFVFFYTNVFLHKQLGKRKGVSTAKPLPFAAAEELAIGVLSGICSKAVTLPISQVVVRLQTSASSKSQDDDEEDAAYARGSNAWTIIKQIYDEKGPTGYFSGLKSACFLTIHPSLTLYLFELFKYLTVPRSRREHPPAVLVFLTSALASSIASTVTYPMILAKTRLQWRSPSGKKAYRSTQDVLSTAYKRNGIAGLFAGLDGQIAKNFLSEGIKMTTKDRVEMLIVAFYQRMQRQQR